MTVWLSKCPLWGFYMICGLLGLCIGSFLNVIICRLPTMLFQRSDDNNPAVNFWHPRSICNHCQRIIPFWLNVPIISYLLLAGKTKCCNQPIAIQYPLVEVTSAGLSLALAWHFGPSIQLIWSMVLTWALLMLLVIDMRAYLLPDQITIPLIWLGLLVNCNTIFVDVKSAAIGVISGYAFFYLIAWLMLKVRKVEGMGRGDFKLLAMLGAWLGWQALPTIVLVASLTGSVFGIGFIFLRKAKFNTPLPFGPFLAIGGFYVLFGGQQLSDLL